MIKDAESHLSSKPGIEYAFDIANQHYFLLGETTEQIMESPWEKVAQAASDYFTTGVAYLANRTDDDSLEEMGTTAWWSVNQKQTLTVLTDNMVAAAIQLGVPVEKAIQAMGHERNREPHVLFMANKLDKQINEVAYVLIPPHFIETAKNWPAEALAVMTWICSQVRDFANGRLTIDPENITIRAEAAEAHLLHKAMREIEETDIHNRNLLELLRMYPKGINSLPSRMRYHGIRFDPSYPNRN